MNLIDTLKIHMYVYGEDIVSAQLMNRHVACKILMIQICKVRVRKSI